MSNTYLLLDVNNLAHRIFHSMPRLSNGEVLTSVVYGMLKDIGSLQDRFQTNNVAFCFDCGWPARNVAYANYKKKRRDRHHEAPEEEQKLRIELIDQINQLRLRHLHDLGFRNIFWQEHREADDVIASICQDDHPHNFIIVSEDKDLYQLLSKRVSMWKPRARELYTADRFRNIYGISPCLWSYVKAIAGCTSDDVVGIAGIGDKLACKYMRGELTKTAFEKIAVGQDIIKRNVPITTLPYEGTQWFSFREDKVTRKRWRRFCDSMKIKSLRNQFPMRR